MGNHGRELQSASLMCFNWFQYSFDDWASTKEKMMSELGLSKEKPKGAEPKCWNLGVVFSVERPLSCARTSQVVLWDWMREVWPSFNIENE